MKKNKVPLNQFPFGWSEERVRRVIEYYERQSEDEAVAEDEAPLPPQPAPEHRNLSTMWAVVRNGKIELLEKADLPEGSRVLITLVPDPIPNVLAQG
jgi:hypothetical protein